MFVSISIGKCKDCGGIDARSTSESQAREGARFAKVVGSLLRKGQRPGTSRVVQKLSSIEVQNRAEKSKVNLPERLGHVLSMSSLICSCWQAAWTGWPGKHRHQSRQCVDRSVTAACQPGLFPGAERVLRTGSRHMAGKW